MELESEIERIENQIHQLIYGNWGTNINGISLRGRKTEILKNNMVHTEIIDVQCLIKDESKSNTLATTSGCLPNSNCLDFSISIKFSMKHLLFVRQYCRHISKPNWQDPKSRKTCSLVNLFIMKHGQCLLVWLVAKRAIVATLWNKGSEHFC